MRRRLGCLAASIGGTTVLLVAGRGELADAPLTSPGEMNDWLDQSGSVVAAFAILRLVALCLGAYLATISALGVLAAACGMARLGRVVDVVTLPSLRHVLGGAGMSTLALVAGVGGGPAVAEEPPPPVDRLVELPTVPVDPTTTTVEVGPGPDTEATSEPRVASPPTMHRVAPDAEARFTSPFPPPSSTSTSTSSAVQPTTQRPSVATDGEPHPATTSPAATANWPKPEWTTPSVRRGATESAPVMRRVTASHEVGDDSWTVQRGESFWSIAAGHLADVTGGTPDDATVDRYWRRLIEVNRESLPTPDPNLLYSGMVLWLPPVERD